MLCFQCGRFGHSKEGCAMFQEKERMVKEINSTDQAKVSDPVTPGYGPWTQVGSSSRGRKLGSTSKKPNSNGYARYEINVATGSRFQSLP